MADAILCAGGIYAIRNTVNGKVYIGSSVSLEKRVKEHKRKLTNSIHENDRLQKAFNKYGESAFVFEVIERVADRPKILEREQYWIDAHQSADRNIGYNIYPIAGSPSGSKPSAAARERMSAAGRKRAPASTATRQLISEALKGKKKSPEHIEKHRVAVTGFKHTAETKAGYSAVRKGVKKSAQECASRTGLKRTAETREKMSQARFAYWERTKLARAVREVKK